MTAIIVSITLGYFITKLNGLLHGYNPIINQNSIQGYYDKDSGIDLNESNLMFAFCMVGKRG